jgi:predicted regulator of amino acid metabolism with ACT domain
VVFVLAFRGIVIRHVISHQSCLCSSAPSKGQIVFERLIPVKATAGLQKLFMEET